MNLKTKLNNKLSKVKDLNQQVRWDYKFGVAKSEPENYVLEFESKPIKSFLFEKTFEKLVSKNDFELDYDDWELDKEINFPKEAWANHEKEIMGIFPKVRLKNQVLLSKTLDSLTVVKTLDGLVVKSVIKGLRKC